MIFIHSSFRTASTWFWSKFRRLAAVDGYYEVFNEQLASLTKEQALAFNGEGWLSKHPHGIPYYLEFRPAVGPNGGIPGFAPPMSFERFIPRGGPTGDVSAEEVAYLVGLIERSRQAGRIPVLSCTRTLGRLAGLRRALPGTHVLLYRNIFHQWCSYSEQAAHGNLYFMGTVFWTIEHAGHDPFIASLAELLPRDGSVVDKPEIFLAFALLHLYLYAAAIDAADLVVDADRLARDPAYRRDTEATIAERTGQPIDLSDARPSLGYSFVPIDGGVDVLTRLNIMAAPILLAAGSEAARAFVDRALADLIREARAFDFYAGAVLRHSGARTALMARVPAPPRAAQTEAEASDIVEPQPPARSARAAKGKRRGKIKAA